MSDQWNGYPANGQGQPGQQGQQPSQPEPIYVNADQLPPNARYVGRDVDGSELYEVEDIHDVETRVMPQQAPPPYQQHYGQGYQQQNYQQAYTPAAAAPVAQKSTSKKFTWILSGILAVLIAAIIIMLCLMFIPGAPLNSSSNTGEDLWDENGQRVGTTSTTTTSTTKTTDSKRSELLSSPEFRKLRVVLPANAVMSAPISTGETSTLGSSYRIINKCGEVGANDACTSEEFGEALYTVFRKDGGIDGDMAYWVTSPVTNERYAAKCEAQNGGKVLCVSGKHGTAGIVIDVS